MTNYEKLRGLLAELFQFDQADLDFGIYRIMNQKREEITRFLDRDLLPQVKQTLEEYQSGVSDAGQTELQQAIKQAQELGIDPDSSPKVQELKAKLGPVLDTATLEDEVFSHLYDFFRRYYQDGDFVSLRRYKEGVYAIPYEGEEVTLYWANHDQYYVKSSENYRDYTFKLPDERRVHFKIVDAETIKDNNRAANGNDRRFMLTDDEPVAEEDEELVIRFVHEPGPPKVKQEAINTASAETILAAAGIESWLPGLRTPAPTEKNDKRTLLDRHLDQYSKRNTFDYFIHKNLGRFLRRELDFYIKNEIMHLDDIEGETAPRVEQYFGKLRALRTVAGKLITFLAQLEDFQKKLWLKKKFVVETNYCVTLDHVPEELYGEILTNEAQIEEWRRLFGIDDIGKGLLTDGAADQAFLAENHHLVLDTVHFGQKFKDDLLRDWDAVDATTDGVMVQGDNFHVLNLLRTRYHEEVKTVYIDPPFNLAQMGNFLYKTDYKDSSWASLLENRIALALALIAPDSSFFVRCDYNGNWIVRCLMDGILGVENFRNEIVVRRGAESIAGLNNQFDSIKSINTFYDNLYWYSKRPDIRFPKIMRPATETQKTAYWHGFWKGYDRHTLRYELFGIKPPDGQWLWNEADALQAADNYARYVAESAQTGEDLEEYWRRKGMSEKYLKKDGDSQSVHSVKYWVAPREEALTDNNWLDIRGYASGWHFKTENSEQLLERVIVHLSKPGDVVLDFFAGSATTQAVSHKLGRKWLGAEMGAQFDDVILPRLKHVLHGEASGISKKIEWKGGGAFKYLRLESYDDTLNNLSLTRTPEQQLGLDAAESEAREEYLLSYMLDLEASGSPSLLNLDAFRNPFEYKLKVSTGIVGETKPVSVDLVETFNYLIGLRIKHTDMIRGVRVVEGTSPAGERVLILWRDVDETNNDALDEWFRGQEYNTRDLEYHIIYVNGDNNLANLRRTDQTWKVRLIEADFHRLMFDVQDV